MAARTLANLGLKAFFAYGEDGWNDEVDTNFLMLSVLVQAGAINIVSVKPSSPTEGDVYVIASNASSNPNTIAVYDAAVWKHFTPKNGWSIYNRATDAYVQWNGTAWMSLPLANLRALGALDGTSGVVTQTGTSAFSKTPLGVGTAASILTRSDGDLRYANIAHSHPASGVTSFNTRTGAVALTTTDVNTALGHDSNAASNINSFASLSADSTGIIEKTGAGSFTTRPVGATGPTSLTTLAQSDARYMPLSPYLVGLVNSTHITNGLIEQTGTNQFAIRAIGGTNNGDILTRGIAASIFLSQLDVDGLQPKGQIIGVSGNHTLVLGDAYNYLEFSNSSQATVTIPPTTVQAFAIGDIVTIEQSGTGTVKIIPAAGVTIQTPADQFPVTKGRHAIIQLKKKFGETWIVFGHLTNLRISMDLSLSANSQYLPVLGI